ncbi:MAG: YdjY domain-containing protein [Phycisphaerae bacterium]
MQTFTLLAISNAPIAFAGGEPPEKDPATLVDPTTKPFQPGVAIDWQNKAVHVEAHVVLRKGPLEFAACFGGKEHESILRIDATGEHIFLALGLIGIEPGRPSQWDENQQQFSDPTGPLIDIDVRTGSAGEPAPLYTWLTNAETLRPALPRPWVYSGSKRTEDGNLLCDRTGAAIALVDFSDNFFSPLRRYDSSDAGLWAFANEVAIPPDDAKVTLIFRSAQPRGYAFRMDENGLLFVNDELTKFGDFAALLLIAGRLQPETVIALRVASSALHADRARVQHALANVGVSANRWKWVESDVPQEKTTTSGG